MEAPPLQQQLASFLLDFVRLWVWLALLLIVFGPLEKRWALHPQKLFRSAFGTDLVYYFLSGLAPKLLLILPMTLIAAALHRAEGHGLYAWVAGLPVWMRLTAAIIVGEIGSYWGHRWSHEVPLLWRFHAIHHSAEEIDWLVNSRAHPVDLVFTRLCGLAPMYILGLAQPMGNRVDLVPVLVTLAGTLWGFFIHANVTWRLGWLEWFVSSPAFHHWHHTNDARIGNYAPMLPWVDKVFGTFYLPKREWPGKYGIDAPTPSGFVNQLLQPLLLQEPQAGPWRR